jgi:hypothetical protein
MPLTTFWTNQLVATPLWGKCEDGTRTPKSGNLESSGTLENSELDCRGQNTSPWSVLYIIENSVNCRCRKWPRMHHSNICSTSYGRKKGRESNWQFDSRPLKVGNRPDPGVCRWIATHCWKALEESYKFALDLVPIEGLRWELWVLKVPGVQTGTISGLFLWSPGIKSHLDVGAVERHREYYMREGGGFLRVRAVVNQVSPCCPWLVLAPRCSEMWTNHFVVCFDAGSSKWIRLVTFPSLNLGAPTRPSTLLVLRVRECASTPSLFPLSSAWGSTLSPSRSWGCVIT